MQYWGDDLSHSLQMYPAGRMSITGCGNSSAASRALKQGAALGLEDALQHAEDWLFAPRHAMTKSAPGRGLTNGRSRVLRVVWPRTTVFRFTSSLS
jgi:hypothetical protein